MEWGQELRASAIWLAWAWGISLCGGGLAVLALARFSEWGRQFRRISGDYFALRRSVRPFLWLAAIVFMTLFSVRLNILVSYWYNGFYSAMQALDGEAFWRMLVVFSVLATIHVLRSLADFYLRQAFMIHWRIWLTDVLLTRWFDRQAYYRGRFVAAPADNPDQRIQQDVDSVVSGALSLAMGLLDAVVSLQAFTLILWGLSGTLEAFGYEIPRAMVFAVYAYILISTVFALKIGRPLIHLSFINEQRLADFRYALVRLREYAESVAFYRGEAVEKTRLVDRFRAVIANVWAIVFRSLKFQGFNLAVSQAAVVFPFIIQAPRLLSGQITLGDVMQTSQAFGQVGDALSFIRSSYDTFTGWRASVNRLAGFIDAADAAAALPAPQTAPDPERLCVAALDVRTPDGAPLVAGLALTLGAGESLLIRGASGIGKTTLLRALAGLWPYAGGRVARPFGEAALFLSQKPYLPLGTLREALYYPAPAQPGEAAAEALRACQLAHLTGALDEAADWSQRLSLGEQQRLAIGRVLLNRPRLVFLDEASSAMDEGLEYAMYDLLRAALPDAIMVSVGHRGTLLRFHARQLELQGGGRWALGHTDAPAA